MAMYNGETFIVKVELEDYLGDVLIGGDLASLIGTLYTPEGVDEVISPFEFVFSDAGAWIGEFSTVGVAPGNYRLKVTVTATDGSKNWEYSTLNIRPS